MSGRYASYWNVFLFVILLADPEFTLGLGEKKHKIHIAAFGFLTGIHHHILLSFHFFVHLLIRSFVCFLLHSTIHFWFAPLLMYSFGHTFIQGSQKSMGSVGRKRKGRWKRLKKRWNRKGVVEVDIDHHRYELLNSIREAIRDLVTKHSELGPKVSLLSYKSL